MNTSGKTEVTSARFRWCPTTPRGALGRALPLGGEVPQDYVFERIGRTNMPETVKMSELFGPHNTLILYSLHVRAAADGYPDRVPHKGTPTEKALVPI